MEKGVGRIRPEDAAQQLCRLGSSQERGEAKQSVSRYISELLISGQTHYDIIKLAHAVATVSHEQVVDDFKQLALLILTPFNLLLRTAGRIYSTILRAKKSELMSSNQTLSFCMLSVSGP